MKERIPLLLFAVLGMAVQGMAQMSLEIPKYTKALLVQSKGINVRAEPSTQSEKGYSCLCW